jgi:hypothetical protein
LEFSGRPNARRILSRVMRLDAAAVGSPLNGLFI